MKSFRSLNPEVRRQLYDQNIKNHPNSVALIIEMDLKSKVAMQDVKLMTRKDCCVHTLTESLKKKIWSQAEGGKADATLSIFLFCQHKLLTGPEKLSELMEYRNQEDNFLYLTVRDTPTF